MFQNLFTITLRSFLSQKFYSVINVVGLSSGLLCVLFIYLWVTDELAKDKFHREGEKIFRVVSSLTVSEGEILTWDVTPGLLAEDVIANVPEVEMAVRTSNGDLLIEYEGKKFVEDGSYADPDFFNLFSFNILMGKIPSDSADVSWIALSNELAGKLFTAPAQALGKIITINGKSSTVTCVYEDPGDESSLQFNFILPYEIYKKNRGDGFNWGNYDHPTYLKFDPLKVAEVSEKINERAAKRAEAEGSNVKFYLQPFEDAYLHSHFENGVPTGGRIEYIRIFSVVGIFMLIIACINFTNMATARAAYRAKEVGIRKVVGAHRKSLISQFISESILISLLSMVIALGLVYMLLPWFNFLVLKSISLDLTNIRLMTSIVGIVLITGFLAGSYPALYLSSYQPAQVLKGTLTKRFSGSSLRKLLVVFQFSLTVILIASSIVIYTQISFIQSKNIGYDREAILWFAAPGKVRSQFEGFANEVNKIPGVISLGKSNESLVQVNNQNSSVTWSGKDEEVDPFFRTVVTDFGYMETMGLKLKEGRFFSREHNDTTTMILTEKAVEVMGLTDPVGATITQWGFKGIVVGVVEDFHSRSLHETMDPVVFFCKPEWTGRVFLRLDANKTEDVLASLKQIYKQYSDDFPFEYSFLEDDFAKLYNTEKVTGVLALGFTLMAIVISGLGLLGLAAYTAERRRKEISIRKTLGASVPRIVAMVSGDFVKLSTIAAVIGCPVAYFLMSKFLAGYAYRTELDWKIFVITALGVTVICVVIVIFQVVRAAIANPVDALRNE